MNQEIAIELKDLHKSFRDGKDKILNGINIGFPRGKLTYILGPSGTGKSVTLKHVLGLLMPDSGEVWVEGVKVNGLKGEALAQHRLKMGMLFQNSALFDDMTIYENVAFPLREHSDLDENQIREKVTNVLKGLGLEQGLDKYPNELSGGMKKRVACARAIIREPSILLYDEPTTGLDPVTRVTVDELIATLKERLKLTSLVISHDIPSALKLADYIAFIFKGQIIFFGTPREFAVTKEPEIRKFLEAELKAVSVFNEIVGNL